MIEPKETLPWMSDYLHYSAPPYAPTSNPPEGDRSHLTSAQRKLMPVHRGALKYFPDALMVVSMLSLRADRKHTPEASPDDLSRPQWVKGKSSDHGDCLVRHQMDIGEIDKEVGLDYQVHVAWRALAQLQTYIEAHGIDSVIDWGWSGDA